MRNPFTIDAPLVSQLKGVMAQELRAESALRVRGAWRESLAVRFPGWLTQEYLRYKAYSSRPWDYPRSPLALPLR